MVVVGGGGCNSDSPGPMCSGEGWLTSSPKVGDGPQLMVLSSAATMMLLFLQTVRVKTNRHCEHGGCMALAVGRPLTCQGA